MAINRVAIRVFEGGHNIPTDVIARRYSRGITNLFKIYIPFCDEWAVFDNSYETSQLIAEGIQSEAIIANNESWILLKSNIS